MMYRPLQQQVNDVIAFAVSVLALGFMAGAVRSFASGMLRDESAPELLTETGRKGPFVRIGERVRYVGTSRYRYETWPKAAWLESGVTGTVTEYHPGQPAVWIRGEYFEAIEPYAVVTWDSGGKTAIHAEGEGKDWERIRKAELLPQVMIEDGERVPPQYRDLVGFISEPLPEYSLATLHWLPQVEPGVKERKIDAVLQQLKDGVNSIQQNEVFRQFLITMSKFHDYSIGNQILIMLQKPDATRVAGFNTWKELGRWVKRGEKGISILAPIFPARETVWQRRDGTEWTVRRINRGWGVYITRTAEGYEPNTLLDQFDTKWEAEKQVRDWGGRRVVVEEPRPYEARHFKVVYVFDLSQTEGRPLPEFEVPVLTGEVNEELFSKLLELMKQRGVPVNFESRPYLPPEVKGQYTPTGIWIRPEEPRAQQLKTLLHEVAHYYSEGVLHIPRRDAETIAESAAFVVGAHHGFDTGVRSFPYVALWAQDKKVLEQNLGAIRRVATTILEGLEEPGIAKPLVPATLQPERSTADLLRLHERGWVV
jgi:hypothetical protein